MMVHSHNLQEIEREKKETVLGVKVFQERSFKISKNFIKISGVIEHILESH